MAREWYDEAPNAPDIDVEEFAYDAPFARPGVPVEAPVSEQFDAYADSDEYDAWDDWEQEEDDDDDLLEALSEALDEVEAEERIEEIRNLACPEHDVAEIEPAPVTMYRDAINCFMGQPRRAAAPRYSQLAVRTISSGSSLDHLLQDSLRRARENMDRWRIHGWASDLPQQNLGRKPKAKSTITT